MSKNKPNPMDFIQIQKRIEELAELIVQKPLEDDEERSIVIPLFIPDFLYDKLKKESFISDSEYTLTRNYETNYGMLFKWFNNIDFQLIPISRKTVERSIQDDKLEKICQILNILDKLYTTPPRFIPVSSINEVKSVLPITITNKDGIITVDLKEETGKTLNKLDKLEDTGNLKKEDTNKNE